jgi:hypothetical protein
LRNGLENFPFVIKFRQKRITIELPLHLIAYPVAFTIQHALKTYAHGPGIKRQRAAENLQAAALDLIGVGNSFLGRRLLGPNGRSLWLFRG